MPKHRDEPENRHPSGIVVGADTIWCHSMTIWAARDASLLGRFALACRTLFALPVLRLLAAVGRRRRRANDMRLPALFFSPHHLPRRNDFDARADRTVWGAHGIATRTGAPRPSW